MQSPGIGGDRSPENKDDTPQYDFSQQSAFADAILVVEGRELYTSRYMLASVSPVFCDMFSSCTDNCGRIPLPDDSFEVIHRMLAWMMPATRLSVTDCDSQHLVSVAYKYGIDKLLQECEGHLVGHFEGNLKDDNTRLDFLLLAQNYKLNNLKESALQYFSTIKLTELKKLPKFPLLQRDTLFDLHEKRVILLDNSSVGEDNRRCYRETECADDINLVVEGQIIPASRTILSAVSPVFRTMFSSSFREADAKAIPLPGKSYEDVKYMIDYISSPNIPILKGPMVNGVVHMSDEYQIGKLKAQCERFMMDTLAAKKETDDVTLSYFLLSKKFNIPNVMNATIGPLAKMRVDHLARLPSYVEADMYVIFRSRSTLLERKLQEHTGIANSAITDITKRFTTVNGIINGKSELPKRCSHDKDGSYRANSLFKPTCKSCIEIISAYISDQCAACATLNTPAKLNTQASLLKYGNDMLLQCGLPVY